MKRNLKYKGISLITDRHGKRRYRLRLTIKGRKISTYINEEFGTAEFERAYAAAINGERGMQTRRDTFRNLIETYIGSPKFASLEASTQNLKLRQLDWLRRNIGEGRYNDMTVQHVEMVMSKKAGPAAANQVRNLLAELFDFATKRLGYAKPNPARLADKIRIKTEGFIPWTDADRAQFEAQHPEGSEGRLAYALLFWTAAARADVVKLTRANIIDGTIHYRRQKTNVLAVIPVAPDLQRELDHIPADQFTLLQNSRGASYTVTAFARRFTGWCREAGLSGLSPHGLRKARAIALAEADASQEGIAAYLGHSNPNEAATYTRGASRATLAANAARKAENNSGTNDVQPIVQPLCEGS